MSVTPESDKTISLTSQQKVAPGPTPKNEFKKPLNPRDYFSSPTDALMSPCTQKLMQSRLLPKKTTKAGLQRPKLQTYSAIRQGSGLADKENRRMASRKAPQQEKEPARESSTKDL